VVRDAAPASPGRARTQRCWMLAWHPRSSRITRSHHGTCRLVGPVDGLTALRSHLLGRHDAADVGDPYIGMRLADRYELLERIGEGGMGAVYRARQLHLDREVVIKVLPQRALRDPARLALFRKEAEALARLLHPNTVRVFECGTFAEVPFLAIELLEGRTLATELARKRAMPAARSLKILAQLCSSLEEAHRAGIVHGDIKPQNVFLLDVEGATDHVKLVDFSLARLAGDQTSEPADTRWIGTPACASPELLAGGTPRPASDVYASVSSRFRC